MRVSRWTGDIEAQKVLQGLVDQGKIDGGTEPQEPRALAPEVFKHLNNQVCSLHIRNTKRANNLPVTTKRARSTRCIVTADDTEADIPQLGHVLQALCSVQVNEPPRETSKTKEWFVSVAVTLMWGFKAGTLVITSEDPSTLVKVKSVYFVSVQHVHFCDLLCHCISFEP
ncbi:hypothetical protein H257_18163 [Aphanomyces astaci]|uniref:Uncharacterized protein n=1 Tax=Aphanomyces astaci TaxID=112090 RepID=W4FDS8_APHAT|nr:hypothetical protein H257_18163 [Aphanomyces astaci]ETV65039.1 hypothetical protein H257_18163 [Aphanomyces astaci]|eukprot:XP_009845475.1 hypothetical protein H257_18163 [Aphanomyces astaci]